MGQRGVFGDLHLEDRVVQIACAIADRQFQQRQAGARASRIRWRGWKAARSLATLASETDPARRRRRRPARTGPAPSSASMVFSATSGSLSGRASVPKSAFARRSGAKLSTAKARRQRGQVGPEPAIDEDQRGASTCGRRQRAASPSSDGQRLHRTMRRRPGAGWCISRPRSRRVGKPARGSARRACSRSACIHGSRGRRAGDAPQRRRSGARKPAAPVCDSGRHAAACDAGVALGLQLAAPAPARRNGRSGRPVSTCTRSGTM